MQEKNIFLVSLKDLSPNSLSSWCSFSMMVTWVNDGLLQANDGKMLVNDGGMLVNDGEMSVWYTYFTIIDEHFTIIRSFDHHREAAPAAKGSRKKKVRLLMAGPSFFWNLFFKRSNPFFQLTWSLTWMFLLFF